MPNDVNELRILTERGFRGVTLPVTFRLGGATAATAANWTAPFFRAQRDYELIGVWERHETASTGAATVMLKKAASGTAPASGTDMLTAELALDSTADTDQSGSIKTTFDRRLVEGDSLCLVTTGALTGIVGETLTVLLKAK